jgi:WD40 repeat protein
MLKKYLLVSLILVGFAFNSAIAKLTLSAVGDIDASNFPECSVILKAIDNNSPVDIKAENIVIEEFNAYNKAVKSEKTADGLYKISWYSNLRTMYMYAEFYFTNDKQTAKCRVSYSSFQMAQLRVFANKSSTNEVFFNKPEPNQKYTVRLDIKISKFKKDNLGNIIPVKIDSIKTYTPYFHWRWFGRPGIQDAPPPFQAYDFEYGIFVDFDGYEDKLYTDKLTVFYEGNQREDVPLIANTYELKTKTQLEIYSPKPGEIKTPCQIDTIKWRGGIAGLTTIIEFSKDGGYNWNEIAETKDTMYMWKIPNDITEKAILRVRQKFEALEPKTLGTDGASVKKCSFTEDGRKIIAADKISNIFEWDVEQGSSSRSGPYKVSADLTDADTLSPSGIAYGYNREKIFITYYNALINSNFRNDTLAIFNIGDFNPIKKIALNQQIKKMKVDYKYRWIASIQELGNTFTLRSPKDASIIKEFAFDKYVSNFNFLNYRDSAIVVLGVNQVVVIDLNKMEAVDTFDFSDNPIMTGISMSPDGEYISFSTMMPPRYYNDEIKVALNSYTRVYSVEKDMLIRKFVSNSEALGLDFNPSSSKIIRASQLSEQVMLYDLALNLVADGFTLNGGKLEGYDFAPEGHNVACFNDGVFMIIKFVYTEADKMDGVFSIRYPALKIDVVDIAPALIDTKHTYIANVEFRNTDVIPLYIDEAFLKKNYNFHIKSMIVPDTLEAGEYANITFEYAPIDTGKVVDTLVVRSCSHDVFLPLKSVGIPRNIYFYENPLDFGNVCVNGVAKKKLKFLKNMDTVDLRINKIEFSGAGYKPFSLSKWLPDTVIAPGQDLELEFKFAPNARGVANSTCKVFHSNQRYMSADAELKGVGIGADVIVSNSDIRFLKEIKKRSFVLKNTEKGIVTLNSYSTSIEGGYKVNNTFPIVIQPGDSVTIEIEYLGDSPSEDKIVFSADPCLTNAAINVGKYYSNTTLSIEDVLADPADSATIVINYSLVESKPYKGVRTFKGEFSVHSGLFLPADNNSVSSRIGKASLTKNKIEGDLRIVGFEVEGDFPVKGELARIRGVAGYNSVMKSPMIFDTSAVLWGDGIKNQFRNGVFQIKNICGDRVLINKANVSITSISPNPSAYKAEMSIKSEIDGQASIEVYNSFGVRIDESQIVNINKGENSYTIDCSKLVSGNYSALVKINGIVASAGFVVIK